MRMTENVEQGGDIIHLEGDIDTRYSPVLRSLLQGKAEHRWPALFLDLSGVEFINSTGVAALIEYWRAASQFGGVFALCGLSRSVRAVFDLTRLTDKLPIYESVEEARSRLKTKDEVASSSFDAKLGHHNAVP